MVPQVVGDMILQ